MEAEVRLIQESTESLCSLVKADLGTVVNPLLVRRIGERLETLEMPTRDSHLSGEIGRQRKALCESWQSLPANTDNDT